MIGSQAYFDFARKYRELTHIITEAFLSSGGRAAYVCFKDELEKSSNITLKELSMGMSDDYKVAVKEGATMVRIGRKLFT